MMGGYGLLVAATDKLMKQLGSLGRRCRVVTISGREKSLCFGYK